MPANIVFFFHLKIEWQKYFERILPITLRVHVLFTHYLAPDI